MVRSVTRTTRSQPLLKQSDGGSNDEILLCKEEYNKTIRCSICCCLLRTTNFYVCYTFCTIVMLCCLFYNKHNSIEYTVLSNLRATAGRFLHDFELQSSAFKDGESIPTKYISTYSPSLQWSHPPLLTQSFVLIVEDLDTAHLFKHWAIYNIPSNFSEIPEGITDWPPGTVVLRNDHNRFRYDGPTAHDFRKHRYAFRLFAIDVAKLELPPGTGRVAIATYEDLYMAMEPFILKEATLIGTYDALHHD